MHKSLPPFTVLGAPRRAPLTPSALPPVGMPPGGQLMAAPPSPLPRRPIAAPDLRAAIMAKLKGGR
jgi:hypothetical protein